MMIARLLCTWWKKDRVLSKCIVQVLLSWCVKKFFIFFLVLDTSFLFIFPVADFFYYLRCSIDHHNFGKTKIVFRISLCSFKNKFLTNFQISENFKNRKYRNFDDSRFLRSIALVVRGNGAKFSNLNAFEKVASNF